MDRLYQIDNSIDLNLNNWIKPNIKILTYSNLRYSDKDNNVCSRNWFELQWFTGINYYYFFEWKKMHRFNKRVYSDQNFIKIKLTYNKIFIIFNLLILIK